MLGSGLIYTKTFNFHVIPMLGGITPLKKTIRSLIQDDPINEGVSWDLNLGSSDLKAHMLSITYDAEISTCIILSFGFYEDHTTVISQIQCVLKSHGGMRSLYFTERQLKT